jgi:hypothetical protein
MAEQSTGGVQWAGGKWGDKPRPHISRSSSNGHPTKPVPITMVMAQKTNDKGEASRLKVRCQVCETQRPMQRHANYTSISASAPSTCTSTAYAESIQATFKRHMPKQHIRTPTDPGFLLSLNDECTPEESESILRLGFSRQ